MSDSTQIDQIKTWIVDSFTAFCDPTRIDEFYACFAPEFTNFYLRHDLLIEGWMSKEQLQAMYDGGLNPNLQILHLTIQRYEGCVVYTCYLAGTVTDTSGNTATGPWRFSATAVPYGDSWQIVHNHWSKLEA